MSKLQQAKEPTFLRQCVYTVSQKTIHCTLVNNLATLWHRQNSKRQMDFVDGCGTQFCVTVECQALHTIQTSPTVAVITDQVTDESTTTKQQPSDRPDDVQSESVDVSTDVWHWTIVGDSSANRSINHQPTNQPTNYIGDPASMHIRQPCHSLISVLWLLPNHTLNKRLSWVEVKAKVLNSTSNTLPLCDPPTPHKKAKLITGNMELTGKTSMCPSTIWISLQCPLSHVPEHLHIVQTAEPTPYTTTFCWISPPIQQNITETNKTCA